MSDLAGAFNYLNGGTDKKHLDYHRIHGDVECGFQAADGLPSYTCARYFRDAEGMAETKFALMRFFTPEQID